MRRALSLLALGCSVFLASAADTIEPSLTFLKATQTSKSNRDAWNFIGSLAAVAGTDEEDVDAVLDSFGDAKKVKLTLVADVTPTDVILDTVEYTESQCKLTTSGKQFTCRTKGAYFNLRKFRTTTFAASRALTGSKHNSTGKGDKTVEWSIKVPT